MTATPQPTPSHRRWPLIVVSLLMLTLASLASWQWREADQREAARNDVLRQAKTLAVQVTSYDFHDVDAYFDQLERVSTGDFARRTAKATDDLREVIVSTQSQVQAAVLAAGVTSLHGDRATVILFVDQTVRNKAAPEPRTDRNRVELTLEQHGDHWLISSLDLR